MSKPSSSQSLLAGRIASLHIHPKERGAALTSVDVLHLVADKGIAEDARYFNRSSRRQVTLIEREQIAAHGEALGVAGFAPGAVRSNIETTGIDLVALIGQRVQVGEALLDFYAPRTPCPQMDELCQGLRELMEDSRQGVLAQVVQSGTVRVGDVIQLANLEPAD